MMANVDREKVLAILRERGPMKNADIRKAMFGERWALLDEAGVHTTDALRSLKADGLASLLPGAKWSADAVEQCETCGGTGIVPSKKRGAKRR